MTGKVLAIATALSIAVVVLPPRGDAVVAPAETVPSAANELAALADLSATLQRALRTQERRLSARCDVGEIWDHLLDTRDAAVEALDRLGSLWLTGRLHSGALRASEVLTNEFVGLAYRAHLAAEGAQALVLPGEHVRIQTTRAGLEFGVDAVPRESACPAPAGESSGEPDRHRAAPLGAPGF